MKHILLLGGCGFVGTMLTKDLLERNYKITVVDIMWFGNYLKPHENLTVIKEDMRNIDKIPMEGIDIIVHLANIANDPSVDLDPVLSWEVNVLSSMQLIEKAIENNVSQFIYASSGSVYGVKEEEKVTEDLKLKPISVYNKTKMISERVLLSYQDKIKLQCIRPATVCGYSPRMRLDLSVNMLTMHALKNRKITVFGGNQERPNIHIKDMLAVYMHFIEKAGDKTGVFNAGFENMSILRIAQTISEYLPSEIVVSESDDPRSYRLNSDKLLNTGFKPLSSVKKAIEEVIEFYNSGLLKDDDKYYNVKWMHEVLKTN